MSFVNYWEGVHFVANFRAAYSRAEHALNDLLQQAPMLFLATAMVTFGSNS